MDSQTKIRNQIQSKSVELSKTHQHLVLEWSTGCGKSLAAVKIVENILSKNPKAKGYLVCKESTHRKNWHDDIKKHRKLKILKNITTLLYASLHKYKDKADFIILDECHALTPKRIKNMMPLLHRDTKLIFLSATIPMDRQDAIKRLCTSVHFDRIPLKKAIEMGLLPQPELVVHKMRLKAGKEQKHYDKLTKSMAYYKDLSESLTVPYPVRNGCRNKFLNLGSQRKKYIAEVKTEHVRTLVKQFKDEGVRFICFTGSIDQAKRIGASSAVHSKNGKENNQYLIDCFNDKTCNELFAVKMLRESVNLTNIERGIITQLDSGIGSFYQMLGRCLRHEFPEMHIVVLDGTQDVVYFKKAMESFDRKYVRVI